MSKIGLIIKREYTTRVKKKSFIIMSIIGPLLFAGMFVLPAWFSSMKDTSEKRFAVVDHTNKYAGSISDTEFMKFTWLQKDSEQTLKSEYENI